MLSPAKASFHRKLAASTAATAAPGGAPPMPEEGAIASEYQLQLMSLGQDLRQLQSLQSVERKIEAKRDMIARYLPWVEGALSAEGAVQDEVVATVMIWAIDLADWDLALRLAAHVLNHGLILPERYKRQPAVFVAEEFAMAGLDNPPKITAPALLQVAELTRAFDMPDQVRAKLAKAIGLAFKGQAETFDPTAENAVAGGKIALISTALEHFNRALELDKASGVKKLIEAMDREYKKLAEAGSSEPAS